MPKRAAASKPKFILIIGDDGVICAPYKIYGAPAPFFVAHDSANGAAQIEALLHRFPKTPVTLLADIVAQDFRHEALPRLSLIDRRKLIKRRLQLAFPQARLTSYMVPPIKRACLMIGVQDKGHAEGPLFAWLARLQHHHPGITLLPVEGVSLLQKLLPDAMSGWAMLLSRHRTGGFRQIVTHKGELIFTRLTPPAPDGTNAEEIAAIIASDIQASLGYLGRLGLADSRELRLMLVMSDEQHETLDALALPVHSVTCISPHKIARHLHLPFPLTAQEEYSDLLFAGWLAQKRKARLPLMLPMTKHMHWHSRIRRMGMRAAVIALCIALGNAGFQAGDLFMTWADTHHENRELSILQKKLSALQTSSTALTEPLGPLRQAVERQRLFTQPTVLPWPALTQLENGLGPEARLTKLDWQSDGDKNTNEILVAEIRLTGKMDGDGREKIAAQFQHLQQQVAASMPIYAVAVTRYPFPALPQESLSNQSDKVAELYGPTAEFTIHRSAP